MEQEFDSISLAFGKLPKPHRDGSGFEGPTKVGEPVNEDDAVNLGSLEKLNLPIYRKKITTENWNDITTPGLYDVVDASGNDKPPCYAYGVLNVYSFNGVINQIYYPDVSDVCVLAKRACPNISLGNWQAWSLLSKKEPSSTKSTCLVNAAGTGAPHETVVAGIPATLAASTRLVLTNPFGAGVPVSVEVEAFLNNRWGKTGYIFTNLGLGIYGGYSQTEGIVVQSGVFTASNSSTTGGVHNFTGGNITTPLPVRVFVTKLEA
ncbi:pyocin knob domain-containing protein [Aeromonas allosaccharophila]